MPKDAGGHGSNPGAHASGIVNQVPTQNANAGVSDATYHANMPPENFQGQIQDMLGMWSGSQRPEALSTGEKQQVAAAYQARGDWRAVARSLFDQRKSAATGDADQFRR
jgi:hypothetical protein